MAPVTYYYIFSITTAAGSLLWLANLALLKMKGRTTFGRVYMIGSPDHEYMMRLARGRNLAIAVTITLLTLTNLAWSVITVLNVNTPSAHILLVAAPIVLLAAWAFATIKFRKEYGTGGPSEGAYKKATHKHDKDNDSWLS